MAARHTITDVLTSLRDAPSAMQHCFPVPAGRLTWPEQYAVLTLTTAAVLCWDDPSSSTPQSSCIQYGIVNGAGSVRCERQLARCLRSSKCVVVHAGWALKQHEVIKNETSTDCPVYILCSGTVGERAFGADGAPGQLSVVLPP